MKVHTDPDITLPEIEAIASALLVESDEEISHSIRKLVQPEVLFVHTALNARDAEDFISKASPTDVVIIDLVLPNVDGFELIARIRGHTLWRDVPVIVLADKVAEPDIARAYELGANEYVKKPYHPPDLVARIRSLVR